MTLSPERLLVARAIDVVTSVSEGNLRQKQGPGTTTTFTMKIPRHLIVALAEEIEKQWPGVITKTRELMKES